MKPLITPADVSAYARKCDADYDDVVRAIEEATQLDVLPLLGRATLERIAQMDPAHPVFLGGTFRDCGGCEREFAGLRKALAYYTWGRLVKTNSNRLTRFGYVRKQGDNSAAVSWEERQADYHDAFAIAQGMLLDTLAYIDAEIDKFPEYPRQCCAGKEGRGNGRVTLRIIGK